MQETNQPLQTVYARISIDSVLMDTRSYSYGIEFGKVKDVCRQYGIKYKQLDRCIEFSAPKLRLQMFIEKLHFSRTMYSKRPF